MNKQAIRHMVIFDLKANKGSADAEKFLADGKAILESIPVVSQFEVLYQVSPKNDYMVSLWNLIAKLIMKPITRIPVMRNL